MQCSTNASTCAFTLHIFIFFKKLHTSVKENSENVFILSKAFFSCDFKVKIKKTALMEFNKHLQSFAVGLCTCQNETQIKRYYST